MSTSVHESESVVAEQSLHSLSVWSLISLILFALAILGLLLPLIFRQDLAVLRADDPSTVAVVFLIFVFLGAEFACTLLGVITGWVGVRRSRGYPELPWAGLALNSALLLLELVLPIVCLLAADPGIKWVVAIMIVIVWAMFAALIGARDLIARAKQTNNSLSSGWPLWWVWFLGVACGTAVTGCILRLMTTPPN
jgi:hypothetical protein